MAVVVFLQTGERSMIVHKKAGQIVSKNLGIIDTTKKSRHAWIFGCDVIVDTVERTIQRIGKDESNPMIKGTKSKSHKMSNGTFKNVKAYVKDFMFIGITA